MAVATADLDRILWRLDYIIALLWAMLGEESKMAGELDSLRSQVEQTVTVERSAIVLLQGLKTALDAAIASGNPAALTDLSAQLGASAGALADAIVANTPAAP